MERPSIRSYSLRGNRMTRAQSLAINAHWDQYAIALTQPLNLNQNFPDKQKVILEIGSGMGEATAEMAAADPAIGIVALEIHRPGIGSLLWRIDQSGVTNVRIIHDDVMLVLPEKILDGSIDEIRIYFPDPWPKNRQHKKRIVQSEFVELVARKLKPNGFIHIATDWQPYANWIKVRFDANSSFTGGVVARPSWRVLSKFEGQGLKKGHSVTDFRYVKN